MSARLVLIGAPGAGKTTVGSLLAARWGIPAIDTDNRVEAVAGMTVADVFTVQGEPAFRKLEEKAVLDALTHDAVVSVGGGAVMNVNIRAALAAVPTVWLQASVADIADRIKLDVPRPLLMGDTRRRLNELMQQRTPIYEACATVAVSTSGKSAEEIADEVQQWWEAQ